MEIFTNLIVELLNITLNVETLELFSKFSTILPLFIVGLGLNLKTINEVGNIPLTARL